jgi:hypothetical protein
MFLGWGREHLDEQDSSSAATGDLLIRVCEKGIIESDLIQYQADVRPPIPAIGGY